jgi:hypothetical protein
MRLLCSLGSELRDVFEKKWETWAAGIKPARFIDAKEKGRYE